MSHPCDVVTIKYHIPDREPYYHYALWVGTNICVGTFVYLTGDLREGMQYSTIENYGLVYPNSRYGTKFLGTIDLSRFGDFRRICESIAPPCKQVNEEGHIIFVDVPLFGAEEWFNAVIARLWSEGVLEVALETSVLLKDFPGYVDGHMSQ